MKKCNTLIRNFRVYHVHSHLTYLKKKKNFRLLIQTGLFLLKPWQNKSGQLFVRILEKHLFFLNLEASQQTFRPFLFCQALGRSICLEYKSLVKILKALVVKNSALHDFGFGKVSQIHEIFLMELQLFGWRHFSKTEVVQNTVLNH